ncbi:hypothetical protein HPP92_006974 [Vanilla planifolia]|uniref:Nitrogen regulatory protein areA GATA-like domain-containing protein n=1 Tax=Vanilla planifolia TaxID=51239 RepID=A0A835RKY5_VANPL|nr:hypothetical protein HPP92_006974 [Vanilla planifolia]
MAVNEWINGYLEAILDSGGAAVAEDQNRALATAAAEAEVGVRGADFNPTRYFVEEVVTSVDETDIYRTWIKVVATRNAKERSSRLENMCWRIWHLARKKKQVPLSPSLPLSLSLSLSFSLFLQLLLRRIGLLLILSML